MLLRPLRPQGATPVRRKTSGMVRDPIDPAVIAMLDELSDGESFFDQMLEVFLSDLTPSLRALLEARERNDVTALFKGAHRLKSAAANIGAGRMNAACLGIEEPARKGDFVSAASSLSELQVAAEEVRAWATERTLRLTGT